MDPREATYTAIRVRWAGDTGSGGLNETGGAALVRQFANIDDIESMPADAHPWPMISVEITPVYEYGDGMFDFVRCDVLFHLYGQQVHEAQPTTNQTVPISTGSTIGAVSSRIRTRFHQQSLTAQGTTPNLWTFSDLIHVAGPLTGDPRAGVDLHRIHRFLCYATRS